MSDKDFARTETQWVVETETELENPRKFRVILLNDDFTTMDFVVTILKTFFEMDTAAATTVMLQVHETGKGICGVYTREIAETKVALVMQRARENGFPLLCIMEEA